MRLCRVLTFDPPEEKNKKKKYQSSEKKKKMRLSVYCLSYLKMKRPLEVDIDDF